MRFIAHRVFRDGETFDNVDAGRLAGYHGVELDVRDDGAGGVCINHAPLFLRRGGLADLSGRGLVNAAAVFVESVPSLEFLFLDIKTAAAAEVTAHLVAQGALPHDVIFNCWHEEEVRTIRAALPNATIFFCIAPIFSSRLSRRRFNDLYVSNSFPFFRRAARFNPDCDKLNSHHINVQMICPETLQATLPDAIDGLCVHRVFHSPALVDLIQRRRLLSAVYGLPSRAHPKTAALEGEADYAIIRKEPGFKRRRLRSAAMHTHDRAA
jgi:hypothetical protein